MTACSDCGVEPGQEHEDGCDVARCLWTGGQRLQCWDEAHDCGRDVWTGDWPGAAECREFGWWCLHGSDIGGRGWVRIVTPAVDELRALFPHITVQEDLNRLVEECRWDRTLAKWVRR